MRILIDQREKVVDDHIGHYETLLDGHAGFEIEAGFGLPQLRTLKQNWLDERADYGTLLDLDLPLLRTQRDALFGLTPKDANGLWFAFTNYKAALSLRRDAPGVLRDTVPNLGRISPSTYLEVVVRFREHWQRVNAALAALVPPAAPFVIGPLTLAALQAKETQLKTLVSDIGEADTTQVRLARAKVERIFGDVPIARRDPDSLIARLVAYHVLVTTNFSASDPDLVDALPEIFPGQSADEPTFRFNFSSQNGDVTVWWEVPSDITTATQIFLKEGAEERVLPLPAGAFVLTFSGVSVEGDLDALELRDAEGLTLADGSRDESLAAPGE